MTEIQIFAFEISSGVITQLLPYCFFVFFFKELPSIDQLSQRQKMFSQFYSQIKGKTFLNRTTNFLQESDIMSIIL